MLNWIIDFSLRHRFLVIAVALAFAAVGAVLARAPGHRRLSRHDAGADSDQHGRPFALARRDRAADHLSGRAGDQRAAGAGQGAFHLEIRPVPGGRHVPRRHRHLLRPAARQRAARHGGTARGNRASADGAGLDGPGRSVPLRPDLRGLRFLEAARGRADQEAHRTADHSRLGGQAATAVRFPAWPK